MFFTSHNLYYSKLKNITWQLLKKAKNTFDKVENSQKGYQNDVISQTLRRWYFSSLTAVIPKLLSLIKQNRWDLKIYI